MTDATAAAVALRHYRTLWLGQEWSATATAWRAEYTAVAAGAFASITILSSGFDGGSATAQRNFEQTARLTALQLYRADKDADYAAEVFALTPIVADAQPSVMYPVFGAGCFPH